MTSIFSDGLVQPPTRNDEASGKHTPNKTIKDKKRNIQVGKKMDVFHPDLDLYFLLIIFVVILSVVVNVGKITNTKK